MPTKPEKPSYEPRKQMKAKNKEPPPEKPDLTPAPNPAVLKSALEAARNRVMDAFQAFHKLLANKKLDRNKSPQERADENKVAQALFDAAQALDNINQGEGTIIVGSIGLRELMKVRDRINDVEYNSLLTRKELNELKEALGEGKKDKNGI